MSRHKALKGIVQESYYDEYDDDGYGAEIPPQNQHDDDYGEEMPQQKKQKKKKPAKSKLYLLMTIWW